MNAIAGVDDRARREASLVALDWGTSAVRGYWLADDGDIVAERSAPLGVQKVAGDFAGALAELSRGLPQDLPAIACGMIGSRQGWVEAPYRDCPAGFDAIARALTPVPGTRLSIVPGLLCRDAAGVPDVMRGEETKVAGTAGSPAGGRRAVLMPGTHAKWAVVEEDGVQSFSTFMSGELYGVLREHSILGRLATSASDDAAFARGVRHSLRQGAALAHDLFSSRTLALTGELAADGVGDYLSGLLIGAEVCAGTEWLARETIAAVPITLLGEPVLVERYAVALRIAGFHATIGPVDAARRGLWRIACAAGLISSKTA